jgi:molybdopterin converting factor small subunit
MAVLVKIPTPLRRFSEGKTTVEAEGTTISEVFRNLDSECPGILERLYDGDGLRRFINVYLNDEDIRFLNGERTTVKDGDRVSIIPAIAGGSRK